MSVPVGRRNDGKLTVLLKAAEVAEYTINITANEKHFPKRYRWNMIGQIIVEAREVLRLLTLANSVRVENSENYQRRRGRQDEAMEHTVFLLTEIDLAYRLFHLSGDRVCYWTGLVYDLQQLIRQWRKSDAERERKRVEEAQE